MNYSSFAFRSNHCDHQQQTCGASAGTLAHGNGGCCGRHQNLKD